MSDAEAKKPMADEDLIDIDSPEALEDPSDDERIQELEAERDDLKDKFMRALADAENARKRGDRARREAEQYGGSKLARDMLPVYGPMMLLSSVGLVWWRGAPAQRFVSA